MFRSNPVLFHDRGIAAVSVRDFTWVHTHECSWFGTTAGSSLDFCRTCLIVTRARVHQLYDVLPVGWTAGSVKRDQRCSHSVGFFFSSRLGNPDVLNNAIDCPGGIEDLGFAKKKHCASAP